MHTLRIVVMFVVLVILAMLSVQRSPGVAAKNGSAGTSIDLEIIGQAINPPPNLSFQYGYVSLIKGLDLAALAANGQLSEQTARFTFYNDTVTERAISNGRLRVNNRVGTMGIYLDAAPNGDWSQPATFQDGEQILGAQLRHHNVFDTQTGAFTTYFEITTVWTKPFTLDGTTYELGRASEQWNLTFSGHSNPTPPPNAYFAGFATGLELRK